MCVSPFNFDFRIKVTFNDTNVHLIFFLSQTDIDYVHSVVANLEKE